MEQEQYVLSITENKIGTAVYIVRAIQSEHAKETVNEKMKRIICRHIYDAEFCPKAVNS